MKNKFAISLTTLFVSGALMAAPAVANAVEPAAAPAVAASRSFTAVSERSNDLLTESSSVSVSDDTTWENTESLKVEQVKSPAEIAEEEAQKKAAEDYAKQQEELAKQQAEQAAQTAQQQTEAASRNQTRESLQSSDTTMASSSDASAAADASTATADASTSTATSTISPAASNVASSAKGATMVSEALSHMGQAMWCTDLVTAALAAVGVSFSGWPADYANIPGSVPVSDISAAQPGDVLVYGNSHVAIYMGNGQAVHGGWGGYPNVGTGSATGTSAGLPTAIVRIP